MVVRLSAALCGVAMIFACAQGVTAKSSNTSTDPVPKKSASRKSSRATAPQGKPALDANGQVANPLKGHVFVSRAAPFLCEALSDAIKERFRAAQIAISKSELEQSNPDALGVAIVGTASMYNPFRRGFQEGGLETASGELYDPAAWTAAILTDLRGDFGGIHYGKEYQPAYALVESGGKQVVVKINDVGPLRPGRVIDLNQQVMHYFDPSLQHGLVPDIMVTPLAGDGWVPGPVEGHLLVTTAQVVAAAPAY